MPVLELWTFIKIAVQFTDVYWHQHQLTNRFHVAVRLFSNRSQMTSKCGKNKKVAHEAQPSVSLMFLPHFDVLCDLLLNRRMATWNLFVLYNKKIKIHGKNALLLSNFTSYSTNNAQDEYKYHAIFVL